MKWSVLKYGFESLKEGHGTTAQARGDRLDVLLSQGRSVADAVRSVGVTDVAYYRWRKEFGGLKIEQVKRLKDLKTDT